jgi:RNA polymerase sigma factor (sigma-70 family)
MKKINSKSVKITKDTSEILKFYYQEIRKIKPIRKDEEVKLFYKYQETKCPKIKELLINNNLRFVLNVAKHYQNSQFYELGDIVSSGNIGLIKAVEEFDPKKGFKFSTYAVWWIKQAILDGITKESKIIKQPIKQHTINRKYLDLKNEFYNKYGFEPNVEDIIDYLNTNTANAIIAKSVSAINENNILSLDMQINKSVKQSDGLTFDEILPSSIMDDERIIFDIDCKSIKLNKLSKIQKIILSYTYGLNDKPELSFKQISDIINMPEREIKNIHDSALKIINNDLQSS